MFLQASVILSTGGGGMHGCWGGMHGCWGACMVVGGVCGCRGMHGCRGHVWLPGVCMVVGGMHSCWGACVGACMVVGGMCMVACMVVGGICGCRWLTCVVVGAYMVVGGGACIGYYEIQSMSGRYASYWNAFLFFFWVWDNE